MNKLITELTSEELIKLLENKPKDEIQGTLYTKNDVLEFISLHKLQTGDKQVQGKVLHNLYKSWSKKPLGIRKFLKQFQLFIAAYKRYSGYTWFKLNIDINSILWKTLKYTEKRRKRNKLLSKNSKRHFDNFLEKFQVERGGFYVKDIVLFNIYDKWIYETKSQQTLDFTFFKNFCKLYFKHKEIDENIWFGVKKSIISHFSEEMINTMKNKKVTRYETEKAKNKKKSI